MSHRLTLSSALARKAVLALAVFLVLISEASTQSSPDPLASWNDGSAKKAVLDFISRITTRNSKDFVPEAERIATFDNDGTLWVEQPMYTQMAFVLHRVKQLAPEHPEWKDKQPFQAALAGDMKTLAESGEQ